MKSSSDTAPSGAAKKPRKSTPAKKFTFTVIKIVLIFLVALTCSIAGLVGGAITGYISTAKPLDDKQLTIATSNKTTFIYDSKNNVIQKLTGKDNKDSEPINYSQAPIFLTDAIISIEDQRFISHPGIDVQGIINAGFGFFKGILSNSESSARGGSTITQQVVKNITMDTQKSLQRKVQEWYRAVELEKKLSKWQILELYMNTSYWGHSCYGVQSASKKYFGKDVQNLSLAQCALLAGITNNPKTFDPFAEKGRANAKNRQEIILKKMLELKKIDQSQYDVALKEDLQYASPDASKKVTSIQSYFVDQVITDIKQDFMRKYNCSSTVASNMIYSGGLAIYTTMDPAIQAAMDNVFTDDKYFPLKNKIAIDMLEHPQASMVILDAQNGQVKALRGGYGKKEASNTLNRASSSMMQRQPGSSIKPIAVYAPAIDLHLITPATIIDDVAVYMRTDKKSSAEYPRNYDGQHDGLTTVRNGLKSSINVVAARVWRDFLGANNSLEYLKKVGIDRPKEGYLSLVMGGLNKGVNPLQMAAAYVPLAHAGMYYEPTTFTLIKDSDGTTIIDKKPKYDAVYSEQTAFIMEDMMKEVTKGQDSTYPHGGTAANNVTEKIIGMPVAGKTGTTSDNTDKWFVGYTPYYVAATWYGYDNDNNIKIALKPDEQSQAMKIWAAVMKEANKGLKQKDFPMPSGIVKKTICIYSGKIATSLCSHDPRGNATKVEYFIKGTEPRDDDFCTVHVQAQVCKDSHDIYNRNLLAGPYCPLTSIITKIFIQRNPPYIPVQPSENKPKDLIYELPAGEYCNVHGSPPTVPGTDGTGTTTGTGITTGAATGITIPDGTIPGGTILDGTIPGQ